MSAPKASPPEVSDVSAPLVITLFGPMQVMVAGQPIPRLRSRKALWLLALLALRHGRPVERDWLAGTLWPDADQDQALANLRTVLSELRGALSGAGRCVQSPNRHSLCLDRAGAEVDVTVFDASVSAKSLPMLEQAVALYQGPLLEGCTEEWVGQERGRREQDCLRALLALADAALADESHGLAADYYRRAAGLDPWRDAAWRGLMEALARGGDVNAALQSYRDFVALLRDDPKAAPDEETNALYARLRTQARQQAAFAAEGPVVDKAPPPTVTGYLPHSLTDLVGREDESSEVTARLRRSRLVTLTGPGGIGKTRLALAVAAEAVPEYADGVWLVALDALTDGGQVPAQIAGVLGLKEEAGRPLMESVIASLKDKRLLLVLDNCEHLLAASAQVVGHLLRECAGVRVLATSREILGVTGETAWTVPGLSVPSVEHLPTGRATLIRVLSGYESIQLFLERAQAVQKTFALTADNGRTVAEICARLGGMPLAIELAAARIKVLTVGQIATRLDDHLGLLTGGSRVAPSRQQTLRATLDWSYGLLEDRERRLLACLSVFSGGWDLEAAETVCAGKDIEAGHILDLLTSLTDKSLVVFNAGEIDGRYRLLEMVRQYAAERLGEAAEAVRDCHLEWAATQVERLEPLLKGPAQGVWLRLLDTEHDNLRAALDWGATSGARERVGLRLAGALWPFWSARGHYTEGRCHLRHALRRVGEGNEVTTRVKALDGAGDLAGVQGDHVEAQSLHEESLRLYRDLGDKKGIAASLNRLGFIAHGRGNYASAWAMHDESLRLYRELADSAGVAVTLGNLGGLARQRGDYASARALHGEALDIHRGLGDMRNVAMSLNNLGNMERLRGDMAAAKALYEEALSLRRELGDKPGVAWSLSSLGILACISGDYALSYALHGEALSIRRDLGHKSGIAWSLHNQGVVAQLRGSLNEAWAYLEECLGLFRELGDKLGCAWSLGNLGTVAYGRGDLAVARGLLGESLSLFHKLGDREGAAGNLRELAFVFMAHGETWKAVRLWGAAQAMRESMGTSIPSNQQKDHERCLAQAHALLGEAAFAAAWEEGLALTWEQAAAYALEEDPAALTGTARH